jgi:transcriptional regulator with XRE-family HTH domain
VTSHEASRTPVPLRRPADRREPLLRDLVGQTLRRERLAQGRTLKEVAEAARISMPYLSELERGRKEASSEVLAAAARALGLSLGDLLIRVHSRLAASSGTAPAAVAHRGLQRQEAAHHGGLCLAA